jgi:excisionase family DNA binding protein
MADDQLNNNTADKVFTIREVANLLNVHPNTIRRWAKKGIIKCSRITPRGDRRFASQDIRQFLSAMKGQVSDHTSECSESFSNQSGNR